MVPAKTAEDLYYLAADKRQGVADGRDWLIDCFPQHADEIRLLNYVGVVRTVERWYEGGYIEMLRNTFNLRAERGN